MRILAGDLDLETAAFLLTPQVFNELIATRSYQEDDTWKVNILEVAAGWCDILAAYHSDQNPQRTMAMRVRRDQLLAMGKPMAYVVDAFDPSTLPDLPLTPGEPINPDPGTHYRYVGWSNDDVVSQAELNAAAQSQNDTLTVPARSTSGYVFFGFPVDPGLPDSLLLDGNVHNQRDAFSQQAGLLSRDGADVLILVSNNELAADAAGDVWTAGYN